MKRHLFLSTAVLSFAVCFSFSLKAQTSPLVFRTLSCESKLNPLGIDKDHPAFSWTFSSVERNQLQSAYEIIVSDNQKEVQQLKGNCWSTGKQISNQNLHIVYAGKSLAPFTKYYWRVRVHDAAGRVSAWSKPSWL